MRHAGTGGTDVRRIDSSGPRAAEGGYRDAGDAGKVRLTNKRDKYTC